MISFFKRSVSVFLAAVLLIGQFFAGIASAQVADTEAPVLIHRQADSAGIAGELQTFLARVSDDFEIAEVTLYYRQSDTGPFESIAMRELLDTLGEYMIAIETVASDYPGLQYYMEAVDTSGNRTNRGFSYAPVVLPLEAPVVENQTQLATTAPVIDTPEPAREKPGAAAWLIGIGALLLVGALAAGGGDSGSGGGGGGAVDPGTVTLTIVSDGPSGN